MAYRSIFCSLTFLLIFLPAQAQADKLKIVASFSIIADLVKEVGGERIELTTLVKPGQDVHDYQPTPEDIRTVRDADLVIVNGINLEPWLGRLIVTSGYSKPIIVASRDVSVLNFNDKLEQDPHAWHSVTNVRRYVENIRDALVQEDRRNSNKYKDNATNYIHELELLEGWIRQRINKVPLKQRVFVMGHNAMQYFSRYYNVLLLAPPNTGMHGEISAYSMARIVNQMRRENIVALFFESMGDNAIAKQILFETNTNNINVLFTETLSGIGGVAPTYLEMMQYNVNKLVEIMPKNGGSLIDAPLSAPAGEDETLYLNSP